MHLIKYTPCRSLCPSPTLFFMYALPQGPRFNTSDYGPHVLHFTSPSPYSSKYPVPHSRQGLICCRKIRLRHTPLPPVRTNSSLALLKYLLCRTLHPNPILFFMCTIPRDLQSNTSVSISTCFSFASPSSHTSIPLPTPSSQITTFPNLFSHITPPILRALREQNSPKILIRDPFLRAYNSPNFPIRKRHLSHIFSSICAYIHCHSQAFLTHLFPNFNKSFSYISPPYNIRLRYPMRFAHQIPLHFGLPTHLARSISTRFYFPKPHMFFVLARILISLTLTIRTPHVIPGVRTLFLSQHTLLEPHLLFLANPPIYSASHITFKPPTHFLLRIPSVYAPTSPIQGSSVSPSNSPHPFSFSRPIQALTCCSIIPSRSFFIPTHLVRAPFTIPIRAAYIHSLTPCVPSPHMLFDYSYPFIFRFNTSCPSPICFSLTAPIGFSFPNLHSKRSIRASPIYLPLLPPSRHFTFLSPFIVQPRRVVVAILPFPFWRVGRVVVLGSCTISSPPAPDPARLHPSASSTVRAASTIPSRVHPNHSRGEQPLPVRGANSTRANPPALAHNPKSPKPNNTRTVRQSSKPGKPPMPPRPDKPLRQAESSNE